ELDEETKLYYFGARYYDPRTSVWQSADAALGDYLNGKRGMGGVFDSRNLGLYGYAGLNPIILVDPDGNAKIMLDPGHGGRDTGTPANPAFKEKDANLKMAFWVRLFLVLRGHDVSRTRTGDERMELDERARMANEAKVDYFVSLHSDSHKGGSRMSTHFDTMPDGKTKPEQVEFSARLTQALREVAPDGVKVRSWGRPLGVLRRLDSSIPGSLIEMGNVQDPSDAKRLNTLSGRIGHAWRLSGAIDKAVGGAPKVTDASPESRFAPEKVTDLINAKSCKR
ncbi:MAG: N-acetylmuramoyl-L-alanine amidase, partial [Patescibacteria group bacterium]